jgi:hypothetical protein
MSSDSAPVDLRPLTRQRGGRLDDGQPVLIVHPLLVSSVQERFHGLAVCAGSESLITQAMCQVFCCVQIGMGRVPAAHTTERLLVRTVLTGRIMTALALLRAIRALDFAGTDAPFGCPQASWAGMCARLDA